MTSPEDLPATALLHQDAYRLVNGKYPPIQLFDDVADEADFEALYAVQALTNPRIQMQVGELHRVPPGRRPWGIPGCNYALGPFVHLSPYGSRFSDALRTCDDGATGCQRRARHGGAAVKHATPPSTRGFDARLCTCTSAWRMRCG